MLVFIVLSPASFALVGSHPVIKALRRLNGSQFTLAIQKDLANGRKLPVLFSDRD
jgi:hypothetical protein